MVSTGKMAVALGAAALTLCVSAPSYAEGRATNSMRVAVRPLNGCRVSATPMVFIVVPPYANTRADATATITVNCTPNIDFNIDIDRGLYSNGINRRMHNATGNDYFGYDVYKDPPRSQVWGTGRTQNLAGNSGTTGYALYTVYGRTEQVSRLKAGSYRDTLTITVTF